VIIATSPADGNLIYGSGGSFGYVSSDGGHSWSAVAPLPTVSFPDGLTVRADGQVFLYGYNEIWRSPDGMRSWVAYGPSSHGGEPVFDPRDTQTALLNLGYGIAVKRGDQNAWQLPSASSDAEMPTHFIFDPAMAGRLLGVGMVTGQVCTATECQSHYTLKFFRSWTSGASWLDAGTIVPTQQGDTPAPCFPRSFSADPAGRLLLHTDCDLFRSADAGASWQRLASPEAVSPFLVLMTDPATAGHLYLMGSELHESHDAGDSWRTLPRVPDGSRLHLATSGDLWAAAADGPYLFDPAGARWLPRRTGINNTTWQSLLESADMPNGHRVMAWVPAGPQPGVVYGIEHAFGCAFIRCDWIPVGAARSLDGGRTWSSATTGISTRINRIVISPADSQSAVAFQEDSNLPNYATRDGGQSWVRIFADAGVLAIVPDPTEPGRWYLLATPTGGFLRTDDHGATWQAMADPEFGTAWTNLLIDAGRFYAIGANGAVAVSDDFGGQWQSLVAGAAAMGLHPGSARWGKPGTTILAGGPLGVVELDLSATSVQPRTGLWAINAENNGQSGRGFQLESRGGTLVLTYFGYG